MYNMIASSRGKYIFHCCLCAWDSCNRQLLAGSSLRELVDVNIFLFFGLKLSTSMAKIFIWRVPLTVLALTECDISQVFGVTLFHLGNVLTVAGKWTFDTFNIVRNSFEEKKRAAGWKLSGESISTENRIKPTLINIQISPNSLLGSVLILQVATSCMQLTHESSVITYPSTNQ